MFAQGKRTHERCRERQARIECNPAGIPKEDFLPFYELRLALEKRKA